MTGFSFTKSQHLRAKSDFERTYAVKCKAADGVLLLFIARNELPQTRIGLSVSKFHAPLLKSPLFQPKLPSRSSTLINTS